ncbi:MAG: tripartite tricarboxylate transporter substrate binding protein, partial [Acetobacteraceae bacterium]|nr:tripartite tricarboxylate transporter substrate binding protein [Acetobacteraceae bacterium]
MHRRQLLVVPALALAAPALAQPAWPVRPVRVVVPYPAGQGTDIFGRRFAEFYARQFGQPFVVENRAGASGSVGAAFVARTEPDGYTLLWGTSATHTANEFLFPSIGYDPVRDFEPVAGILRLGMVAITGPGAEHRDLAALVRARPGRTAIGVPCTPARAVVEMLRRAAG